MTYFPSPNMMPQQNYGYPFWPAPATGPGNIQDWIEDQQALTEFMENLQKKREKEDKEKKDKDKKPDKKGLSTLEVCVLLTLASPIIGPIYLTLLQWGVEHMRTALH